MVLASGSGWPIYDIGYIEKVYVQEKLNRFSNLGPTIMKNMKKSIFCNKVNNLWLWNRALPCIQIPYNFFSGYKSLSWYQYWNAKLLFSILLDSAQPVRQLRKFDLSFIVIFNHVTIYVWTRKSGNVKLEVVRHFSCCIILSLHLAVFLRRSKRIFTGHPGKE